MTNFWLDKIIQKTRLPYPLFFILMASTLYLIGIPFMAATKNLETFLSESRWIIVAAFNAFNGILIIFFYRKFIDSLGRVEHLISDDILKVENRVSKHLTSRFYIIAIFLFLLLKISQVPKMLWWNYYNYPQLVTIFEFIHMIPSVLLGGIFMYMIPIGATIAYRNLCLNLSFKKEDLRLEWMDPFRGFKSLITMTMFGAVIYSIFPPSIWGSMPNPELTSHWLIYFPYAGIATVLISVVLFPHYYLHTLFSRMKSEYLKDIQRHISRIQDQKMINKMDKILLLFEKSEIEKMKTWLIDIKIFGEIVIIAIIHVILIEILTNILHH